MRVVGSCTSLIGTSALTISAIIVWRLVRRIGGIVRISITWVAITAIRVVRIIVSAHHVRIVVLLLLAQLLWLLGAEACRTSGRARAQLSGQVISCRRSILLLLSRLFGLAIIALL